MGPRIPHAITAAAALCATFPAAHALTPEHRVEGGGIRIAGVGPDNPILYDNDWWTDVPDAAYIWAKASLGEAKLVGNVVTRCTFGWETKYAHTLAQQTAEADRLFALAGATGLRHVPKPVIGSTAALRKPASGVVEETKIEETDGMRLIIAEARKASVEKPLLVFVGGSCTTIASAVIAEPSIAGTLILFQIDGGDYTGSDQWAWEVAMRRCRFVNWARGYFWDKVGPWKVEPFKDLPANPMCDFLREYAASDLGKANQWGDGAWLFELFRPGCLTRVDSYDGRGITVPLAGNKPGAMAEEFFSTMKRLAPAKP
jgi:hypothetical protein